MNFYEDSAAVVAPTDYHIVEQNGHGVILIHTVYYYYGEFHFRTRYSVARRPFCCRSVKKIIWILQSI